MKKMTNGLKKHTDLEIYMEFMCTRDKEMKQRVFAEIRLRNWGWLKKTFLKAVCTIALLGLILGELQYDSFMYTQKEIVKAFIMMMPMFSMILCALVFIYFNLKYR